MRNRGARAAPAPAPATRFRTSTCFQIAAASTPTSTSTPVLQRAMRAPGHPQGCFVTEVVMDELADAVRMDPVEFRIKNLPPLAPNAMWRRYFPMGAERIGWSKRHPTGDPDAGIRSSAVSAARPIAGAAPARARARTARFIRTAACSSDRARRTLAPPRRR